jgi:AAA domain
LVRDGNHQEPRALLRGRAGETRQACIRRLEDYHEVNAITAIVIGSGALDIRNERDVGRFIGDVKRAGAAAGEAIGLVIIDTFSRSLNGGDENSQSDVGDAVKNMQKIVDETGVHLIAKKRMRGSSVLTGGIDKSFLVTQPKKGEIIIAGVKDNDPVGDGAMPPLKLLISAFKTGVDPQGRDVTVPCLTLADTPHNAEDSGRPFTFDKANDRAERLTTRPASLMALRRSQKSNGAPLSRLRIRAAEARMRSGWHSIAPSRRRSKRAW